MHTAIHPSFTKTYQEKKSATNLWTRFIQWSDKQEKNRLGWTAATIAGHGCFFTIITLAIVLLTGNHFIFWPFAMAAMTIPLVAVLAAMPTKIFIPLLAGSVVLDILIIAISMTNGFDLAGSLR